MPGDERESSFLRRLPRVDSFDVAGEALVFARSTGRSQVFGMRYPPPQR